MLGLNSNNRAATPPISSGNSSASKWAAVGMSAVEAAEAAEAFVGPQAISMEEPPGAAAIWQAITRLRTRTIPPTLQAPSPGRMGPTMREAGGESAPSHEKGVVPRPSHVHFLESEGFGIHDRRRPPPHLVLLQHVAQDLTYRILNDAAKLKRELATICGKSLTSGENSTAPIGLNKIVPEDGMSRAINGQRPALIQVARIFLQHTLVHGEKELMKELFELPIADHRRRVEPPGELVKLGWTKAGRYDFELPKVIEYCHIKMEIPNIDEALRSPGKVLNFKKRMTGTSNQSRFLA